MFRCRLVAHRLWTWAWPGFCFEKLHTKKKLLWDYSVRSARPEILYKNCWWNVQMCCRELVLLLNVYFADSTFMPGPFNVMQAVAGSRLLTGTLVLAPRWQTLFYFIASLQLLQPLIFFEAPTSDAFSRKTWRKSNLWLIHTYIRTHKHTRTQLHIKHVHEHTQTHTHTETHTHTQTYTYTQTHTDTNTHRHTHTHCMYFIYYM